MKLLAGDRFLTPDGLYIGTIGGFFTIASNPGKIYGLTNSHVVATCGHGNEGDTVYGGSAPGNYRPVGKLWRFSQLEPNVPNAHDFALVELNGDVEPDWKFTRPSGIVSGPQMGNYYKQVVKFDGANSGHRKGILWGIDMEAKNIVMSECQSTAYNFANILVFHNSSYFSAGGDSGSLILSAADDKILGVLIGGWPGNQQYSIGFPFWMLYNYFELEIYQPEGPLLAQI